MQTMTIGRLAKAAGVNIDTIRYYERHGLLPRAARRESGYREYARADVARLTFIRRAKELGFSLGDSLRGNLLLPGHPAYEEARRVINAQMNKHPALIVQPRGAADVKQAVDFARANSLLVAVKCGGHSPSGKSTCDKGMMIDLSLMRSVRVDPKTTIARVAGGSLLGDMDTETMAYGLVTTAGTVSHTGVVTRP